jgi:hypothetical protein
MGHVSEIIRHAYRISVGTLERNKPIERPRRRKEDNIKVGFI